MSFLPLYNALVVGVLLLSLFMWQVGFLPMIIMLLFISVCFFWFDLMNINFHYESAFWLFILSEVMAFGGLLSACMWFDSCSFISLSSPIEIPLFGCFLLLGSSVTVTGFHHLAYYSGSWVLLFLTVILGLGFVMLQMFEMDDIFINILDSSFHASSFCTVGLHFSHVLVGILGLCIVLILGVGRAGFYRCTVVTWYWHFVDYVWLFVYTIVYVC